MGKGRLSALALAVVILGLALMRTATASHDSTHQAFSGGSGFKGLVVKTDTDTLTISTLDPNWTTVDSRGFQIPAGESQLVGVDFLAEVKCPDGSCSVRALVGRTLATAQELAPAGGVVLSSSDNDGPKAHAMGWALCIANETASPLNVSVWLQANKTGSVSTAFAINSRTFKIARNAPCSPSVDI